MDFLFRFDDINIAPLLKRLQDPVHTFGIAVCQEVLETPCIGSFVKYQRFIRNMTVSPRRYAAKSKPGRAKVVFDKCPLFLYEKLCGKKTSGVPINPAKEKVPCGVRIWKSIAKRQSRKV